MRRWRAARDHPRIRGEHASWAALMDFAVGSSPHTRGAQCRISRSDPARRIIPAYAGSTPAGAGLRPAPRDHPRIRGEHTWAAAAAALSSGSSPHTRGAPLVDAIGQSLPLDHPRIRGEHTSSTAPMDCCRGSSPHTRGAHTRRRDRGDTSGIIPAYAGSTHQRCRLVASETDHPRIRGEHSQATRASGDGNGSSPHTRGAPPDVVPEFDQVADHPRIRGEHCCKLLAAPTACGSSPHTRGARVGCHTDFD